MTATPVLAHRTETSLRPNPSRVLVRLFLPGEELLGRSRAADVINRILALPESEVESLAATMLADFSGRHRDYQATIAANFSVVKPQVPDGPISAARMAVLGGCFTAEFAVEAAALCNPSAVLHPNQDGLASGQARVAISLRGIGEGHISSIGFAEAIVGPGATWSLEPRALPMVLGVVSEASWRREHLRAVLNDLGRLDGLALTVLAALPDTFAARAVPAVLAGLHQDMLARPGGPDSADQLRRLVASIYETRFPIDGSISQQVLFPVSIEESNGIEDARFVRFAKVDGDVEFRATYTAYDGRNVSPRLLISSDLREFQVHRLGGRAARNKGMALFPRLVGRRHLALCRSDGENTSLASSPDGFFWGPPELIQTPSASWEVLQIGNCGSPIETDRGWLVLTHGVGPMRTYKIGAILLDLTDPRRVIAKLECPLLQTEPDEQDGYVPNVVYSCGAFVHEGLLWLPYGIGDSRIGVAWAILEDLLAAMTPT